jgi:protein gp37
MYFLDRQRNIDPLRVFRVKNNFDYPLQKNKKGEYKVQSGETLRVCMTSDFFIDEADSWRPEAWDIISKRKDVVFFLLTKRPERVLECLPKNWSGGWENVFFNVTAENQLRADERLPLLLDLPFKHKGVMVAPVVGEVSLEKYLKSGVIERVVADGENYDGSRVLQAAYYAFC